MRILNLIPDGYPTFRQDVAALFGKYLPRLNVYTDLVAQASDGVGAEVHAWGGGQASVCRRTGSRTKDQLISFWHDLATLSQLRRGRYDAIQVRDKVFAAVFAIWVARWRGIPIFYWMSFPMSERYIQGVRDGGLSLGIARWVFWSVKGYLGREVFYRYVLPRCTHVFVQSDRMREDVAARGLASDRMTAVPMGVDFEQVFPSRADALTDPRLKGRRVVAYLGTFDRPRRLEFVLEVIKQLTIGVPDAVLLMIGDGPLPEDRQRLERHAEQLGMSDRVVWTGWVPSKDAWRWLVGADVAISLFPRGVLLDSASPTKLVEYMALGIPVVANDQPDQKQVIDESGAGICTKMEQSQFVAALQRILSDPAVAKEMSTAGPLYSRSRRGYHRISEDVARVYRRFVPNGG